MLNAMMKSQLFIFEFMDDGLESRWIGNVIGR